MLRNEKAAKKMKVPSGRAGSMRRSARVSLAQVDGKGVRLTVGLLDQDGRDLGNDCE
jgi:hypothetical protein